MFCTKCNKEKNQEFFYKQNKSSCKECMVEANKRWRNNSTKFKEWQKKYKDKQAVNYSIWYNKHGRIRTINDRLIIDEWKKNNPEKVIAHRILKKELENGRISKPQKCSVCSVNKRVLGHHEDYSKPLEVIWVCGSCHKKMHIQIK